MADVAFQQYDLGRTFYNGGSIDTSSSYANAGNASWLGRHRVFKFRDLTDPTIQTDEDVHAVWVQNRSGITLLPSMLVQWSATGHGKHIAGYTATTGGVAAGVVDPYVRATGVPDGDCFWVIVRGPCLVYRGKTLSGADLAAGDIVYAITAAASTHSTTAGRFDKFAASFTATETTDTTLAKVVYNAIGRARSAAVTNTNTTAKVLVDLRIR